jgi:PAS domain S-box-containing protein
MGDTDATASGRSNASGSSADRKGGMAGDASGAQVGALLDHIPEMVTISNREGSIVYANPATERVSGYAPEEFATLHPFERIHPEDRSRCEETFGSVLRTPGLALELEHRAKHKDGTWRWMEVTLQSLFDDPEVGGLLSTVRDVTWRRQMDEALRESEARQAFLLGLSDALRPLGDPAAIQETANRMLGKLLEVDRAAYGELAPGGRIMTVARDWTSPGTASVVGEYHMDDFGRFFTDPLWEGKPSVIEDASRDPRVSRPMYESIGVRSAIAYPLVKQGRVVAAIFVHEDEARAWSAGDVSLVTEVGERTWEAIKRARAEAALAVSEEQYRTLFASIDEGFCTIEVIFDGSGESVDYRFLEMNPAFERQTGL